MNITSMNAVDLMKTLGETGKRFFTLSAALITAISLLTVNASAYVPAIPFETFTEDNLAVARYFEIWENENAEKDFTFKKDQSLRITALNLTEGKLVIKNGAAAVIKGEIFIERGGTLDIECGTVLIDGGNITNCGRIKIGEKGTLKVQSGTLNSTAAGEIQNDGRMICLNKKLDNCFKSIKKYDGKFNLSDYSFSVYSNGSSAKVTANYCIGDDIMTNYRYKFDISKSGKKVKIVHSDYSLETVYDPQTAQQLQNRISSFKKSRASELNFKMWYWKDYGYTYNYKSNKLVFNAKWISYDDLKNEFLESSFSEKV